MIIFLAIYSTTKLIKTERSAGDSERAKEIETILNPIQTYLESGKSSKIELPYETRLYNECEEPSKFDVSANGSPINCGGHSISTGQNFFGTIVRIGGLEAAAELNTSIFGFVMDGGLVENQVSHCAIVEVTKNADGSTNIYSRGYNTCDASHPRRVERGVEVTY